MATASAPAEPVIVMLSMPETIRQGYPEICEIATSQVITINDADWAEEWLAKSR
ncbi:MAG TPA: hypothetical protein IGR64_12545 [Leptolyngbyaceae cyanobacterium M65_K2018_010]|nr:hypothetical protein [Leptolyngbyaceae cyanobacterium M65_K2018_010]